MLCFVLFYENGCEFRQIIIIPKKRDSNCVVKTNYHKFHESGMFPLRMVDFLGATLTITSFSHIQPLASPSGPACVELKGNYERFRTVINTI